MSNKDEFDFDIPDKKEKPQREKKESKPLFGEDSFLGGLFKKSASFEDSSLDDEAFFDKEKKGNNGNLFNRLKWWHILLIILGAIIIVVGIIAGVIIGQINDKVPGGIGGIIGGDEGGEEEKIPEPEGIVSSVGTFLPKDTQEYILCEYTEYFSGEKTYIVQKESDMRYGYNGYFVFISYTGEPLYNYSGAYTDEYTPEQIKADMLEFMSGAAGYTPEKIALCDVNVYNPVSFTRVTISEVTLTETEVTVKYSAGAVDGEMSEEYTLTGTYTKTDNDFAFSYTNLPEDENLLRVAESLLGSAKYESYVQYGAWVNELTFGDNYKLTLISPTAEE